MLRVLSVLLVAVLEVSAADYVVGPGRALAEVNDVPWESLRAGDRVLIHARAEPYRSKFVLCCRGTAERPIRIVGVKDGQGRRPVIEGRDAVTRKALNFWGEERAVIKIGGANRPADVVPEHIVVSGLEVRGGRRPYGFTGRNGRSKYAKNAAAFYLEKGRHIRIEDCVIHDNGNGIISAPALRDLTVSGCHIFGNGVEGSFYEHNAYMTGVRVTFEFNRFGPLRAGCLGNNFKDRSAGLRFRCNWVEGGNRCLDLVDAGAPEIINDPLYGQTMVWGNVLLKSAQASNNQVVHYGGDSGDERRYRKGGLLFYSNTVISLRSGNTVLFRPSSRDMAIDCRNNIVFVPVTNGRLFLRSERCVLGWSRNWFSAGWAVQVGERPAASSGDLAGRDPGFVDWQRGDFRLREDSPARGYGGRSLFKPEDYFGHDFLQWQYRRHLQSSPRMERRGDGVDLGAFGGG